MTKSDFIKKVVAATTENEYTQKEVSEILEAEKKVFTEAMVNGEKLTFVGFGSFEVNERAAREGRNPATGEPMHIEASKSVKFKPGSALKEAVKNS